VGSKLKFVKVPKSCITCNLDLGLVNPHQKYCKECKDKRGRDQRAESFQKKKTEHGRWPVLRGVYVPSPCDVDKKGNKSTCIHSKECTSKKLACRSYWRYTQSKPFLTEPKNPNKGYWNVSYTDNYDSITDPEMFRLISLLPIEFIQSDFFALDSFLPAKFRRQLLSQFCKRGILSYLGGYRHRTHPHYGQAKYQNQIREKEEAQAKARAEHRDTYPVLRTD